MQHWGSSKKKNTLKPAGKKKSSLNIGKSIMSGFGKVGDQLKYVKKSTAKQLCNLKRIGHLDGIIYDSAALKKLNVKICKLGKDRDKKAIKLKRLKMKPTKNASKITQLQQEYDALEKKIGKLVSDRVKLSKQEQNKRDADSRRTDGGGSDDPIEDLLTISRIKEDYKLKF